MENNQQLLLLARTKTRTIYIPSIEKCVTLGQYVKAIKKAKQFPNDEFKYGLTCWWPCLGKDIVKQFLRGVNERINQGVPYSKRGLI
jgi:hypothetical protein